MIEELTKNEHLYMSNFVSKHSKISYDVYVTDARPKRSFSSDFKLVASVVHLEKFHWVQKYMKIAFKSFTKGYHYIILAHVSLSKKMTYPVGYTEMVCTVPVSHISSCEEN